MDRDRQILTVSIDGMWMPMDLARLCHLVVRFYRFEQLFYLKRSGGPDVFGGRFSPVVLKYLAAFDWLAAPLMSTRFNESFVKSEDFIRDFGVTDLRVAKLSYDAASEGPGEIAFAGIGAIVGTIHDALETVLALRQSAPFIGDASQGRFATGQITGMTPGRVIGGVGGCRREPGRGTW